MKTADFFNLFKYHKLGKKRTFGSYRVIDGDNCQLLVRSSTRYGVPNGSELIAITFSDSITLWHDANLRQIKWSVVDAIAGVRIRINSTILDESADNLIDSGIVDVDTVNNKMLIEIGDAPWLFEHEAAQEDEKWKWMYNVGTKLGKRVPTIAEALVEIKPQPNTITALGWTMERCPEEFTPDGITQEDRAILSKPINPMDYGFQVEHCKRETTYVRGSVGGDLLFLRSQYSGTADGMLYMAACDDWDKALSRYDNMRPGRYENISSSGGEMMVVGGPTGTLYLRGEHRMMYDSEQNIHLKGWHKLLDKSVKLRLKG